MGQVTVALLQKICPQTNATTLALYVDPLNAVGIHFGLTTEPKRMAAFLAQVAHESGGFTATSENLNYSAPALNKTFKKYFPTVQSTVGYVRNPQRIANKVYANRMGNGDEASGDGYKYRGRGLIQLTGKQNYAKFATALNKPIEFVVSYIETPPGATASAGWYWDINKLSIYADKGDFVGLTRRINGGTIGLEDRIKDYNIALEALS